MIGTKAIAPGLLLALAPLLGPGGGPHALGAQVRELTSAVRGRVVQHETGEPLEGAEVTLSEGPSVLPDGRTRVTGSDGTFSFETVPPGRYRIRASLVGFITLRDTLRVLPVSELELTLPLSADPVPLEPIVVVARRAPIGPLAGFERRRSNQRGTFITREDIERRNPYRFTDLLRTLPGVRLVPTNTYGNVIEFRGGCTPDLWVDGTRAGTIRDVDSFLRPEELAGVEVYRGPDLPGEFGSNLCGAIVAWTRRGYATDQERSIKTQLVYAGAFLLLVFFAIR